ncbi:hypothetical protein SELMODRAFT_446266 [Selaginella moellendorffii]|uniref:F-box domain-containing protein n=1 Tax=Selaginella moellendorffii TaxID=88036 RepID=D8SPZ3_SELML|nr:uncharacterized protein LOC9653011 [Selaginella moellendorffii]XP_024515038.1 uncharacterized protein LOC9653011 [Selaginella moellendorffii]EFJ13501.1 hypothetical protein SELMODRAFT_446266 [Selaginella moellendorffii]|eukprot:XP_024515037.1 uncharacterized protein LOC9653011 [Selaginella moellendorffii]
MAEESTVDELGPKFSQEEDQGGPDWFERLPEHVLIEILIRIPAPNWPAAACAKKQWAALFKSEELWRLALLRKWPHTAEVERWPGPIGRGCSKRRYRAMHASKAVLPLIGGDVEEVAGHVYLYLKEQLESASSVSYSLLHGTTINQFLACKMAGNEAQALASQIWIAVINNLDKTDRRLSLLIRAADVFLPSYSKSHGLLVERIVSFRDCHRFFKLTI